MLLLRKLVFYILALIYLILCPLIVARMLGFVINPLTFHLIKTGLIYISTNPPDALVYVDGRLAHQHTPTVLRDLPPGEHFIRIELDGYNDWEGSVPVIGRKATLLANTLLIPQAWPVKTVITKPYHNIFIAGENILVATNAVLKNIDIFHTTLGLTENFSDETTYQRIPLFSEKSIYAEGQLEHLYTAPLSPFILLEAAINDKHKFLWVNLNENPIRIEDISDLFPQIPDRIAWSHADDDNIFAFYPQSIYRINIKDKAIYPQNPDGLPVNLMRQPPQLPKNKFLINDNNDLLIREGNRIRIYPKEDFSTTPQISEVAQSRPLTNMYFEEKTGELFYLDGAGNLSAAQILPYHPMLNIPIPDALRIEIPNKETSSR